MLESFDVGGSILFTNAFGRPDSLSAYPRSCKVTLCADRVILERPETSKPMRFRNKAAYLGWEHTTTLEKPYKKQEMPKGNLDYPAILAVSKKRSLETLDLNHPWACYLDARISDRYNRIDHILYELSVELKKPDTTLTQSHITDFLRRLVDGDNLSAFGIILSSACKNLPYIREEECLDIIVCGIDKILENKMGFNPWGLRDNYYRQIISVFPEEVSLPSQMAAVIERHAENAVNDGRAGILDWIMAPLAERRIIPIQLEGIIQSASLQLAEPDREKVKFIGRKYALWGLAT